MKTLKLFLLIAVGVLTAYSCAEKATTIMHTNNQNGNSQVEDKVWELVELNGKAINGSADNYYLTFNSKDGMISAKAGCNVISVPYTIENEFKLTTKEGISTMMACPDMEDETELKEVLKTADNISVSVADGVMTLNKGRMAPLAKFNLKS